MLKRIARRTFLALAALLAATAFNAPPAHAAATYDITQVGDASWVSVTDANGRELSGQTTPSNNLQVTATIRLRIDDIDALREGDTVRVGAACSAVTHFGPTLFFDNNLASSLLDGQGNAVFTVSYYAYNIFLLTRTGTPAQGSYTSNLTVDTTLWSRNFDATSSTWMIGKSSTYTFSSHQSRNTHMEWNNSGRFDPSVNGRRIDVNSWFTNAGTMTALANGRDTSGFKKDSQISWAHVTAQTGEIRDMTVGNHAIFIMRPVDGRTPGQMEPRFGGVDLTRRDVDISSYEKAVENLPVGSFAVMRGGDGSWFLAFNVGSRLPGLVNSMKTSDSTDPVVSELQNNTGHIWQVAQVASFVSFQDAYVPNRVKVETQSTEAAYQTTTLTTKPAESPIGHGQSAIRYDPNGGDADAFKKVGNPGTTTTTAEAGIFLRKGYTFAGWNTKANGTGTAYQAGADVAYPVEGNTLTLYAQWEANTYKTEFRDWQGRTITSGTAKYGTTPTMPALSDTTWLADPDMNFDNVDGWHKTDYGGSFEFTKDGLITRTRDLYGPSKKPFDGMVHIELQGDASKANGQIGVGWHEIGNPKAYMEWNRCEKGQADCVYDGYSTPFKDNNIETWLQIDSNADKGYGELLAKHMQLTQVDPTTHNGVARDGYVFTGWDKDVTKPIEGDTVYTAQYRPAVYKVRFDGNGATSGSMADQSFTYGASQELTAVTFQRGGYRFIGWNTRRDGKGKAFTDKQAVADLLAHEGAVGTLYAQWTSLQSTLPQTGGTARQVTYGVGLSLSVLGVMAWLASVRRRHMI